jgi:hypothetical protein
MNSDKSQPIVDAKSRSALDQGLYVIETSVRNQDKTLPPYSFRASFLNRDDAFASYGKWHQTQKCRVIFGAGQS